MGISKLMKVVPFKKGKMWGFKISSVGGVSLYRDKLSWASKAIASNKGNIMKRHLSKAVTRKLKSKR